MEIIITGEHTDNVVVRTSLGHIAQFKTMDEAVTWADGLQKGYTAAIAKLGNCLGWKRD